jgi:hypothetical protein
MAAAAVLKEHLAKVGPASWHEGEWEDVTDFLPTAGCPASYGGGHAEHLRRANATGGRRAELAVGQMVHVPAFSLYEAMSAMELMDPRMDSGMATDIPTIGQLVGGPRMPAELTALQVVEIMDRIVIQETEWLAGHNLAQVRRPGVCGGGGGGGVCKNPTNLEKTS